MEVIPMHHARIVEASEDAVLLEFYKDGYSELAVSLKELCFVGSNKVTKPQKELRLEKVVYLSAVLDFQSWKPDVWKVVAAWTKRKPMEAYKVEEWKQNVASLYKDKRYCLMSLKLLSQKRITEKGLYESLEKNADVEGKAVQHVKTKIELNADGGSSTFSVVNSCLYFDLFSDASYKIRKYICDQYPELVNFFALHSEVFKVSKAGIISLSRWKEFSRDTLESETEHDSSSLRSKVGTSLPVTHTPDKTHTSQYKNKTRCGGDNFKKTGYTCQQEYVSKEGKNETKPLTETLFCIEDEPPVESSRCVEECVPSFVEPVSSVDSAKDTKGIKAIAVHGEHTLDTTKQLDNALIIRSSAGSVLIEPFPNVHAPKESNGSKNITVDSKLNLGTVQRINKTTTTSPSSGTSFIKPFSIVRVPKEPDDKAVVHSKLTLETVGGSYNAVTVSSCSGNILMEPFRNVLTAKQPNLVENMTFLHSKIPWETVKQTDNAVITIPLSGPRFVEPFSSVHVEKEPNVSEDIPAVHRKLSLGSVDVTDNALTAYSSSGVKVVNFNRFVIPEKTNYSLCESLIYTGYKENQNGLLEGNECGPENETTKEASFKESVKSADIKSSRNASTQTLSSGPILSMAHLTVH